MNASRVKLLFPRSFLGSKNMQGSIRSSRLKALASSQKQAGDSKKPAPRKRSGLRSLPFFLVFFGIYGAMHAYVFFHAQAALHLGPGKGIVLAFTLSLLALMPFIAWSFEQRGWHRLFHTAAWVAYPWMGFLFLLFWVLLAFDLALAVAGGLPGAGGAALPPRDTFLAALAAALGLAVYGVVGARRVRVRRLAIPTPKLAPGQQLKIVQISDLHVGAMMDTRRLAAILAQVQAVQPDLIVSTGDLVDGQSDRLDGLSERFAALAPRLGKLAVTGNHEFFVGLDTALDFTRRCGFRVLRNEAVEIAGLVTVAGVDDPAGNRNGESPESEEEALLARLPRERFTLLLKHRPVVAPASLGCFDLQLSGHVHGGQIFPFGLLVRLSYPARPGLTRLAGGSALYVSRGTGTWGPPLRLGAPPEITVIELIFDPAALAGAPANLQ